MTFTIITATFNAAATVEACIRSVAEQLPAIESADSASLPQSFDIRHSSFAISLEHLIVDGGSRDGTLEAVRACAGPALRLVCSEADGGVYDAFNKGLRQATGDLVLFLGADDQLLPGALQQVTAEFARHPEAVCVHGNIEVNGRTIRPATGLLGLGGARLFHPATFMRREYLLAANGFDTRFPIAADLDLFLRLRGQAPRRSLSPQAQEKTGENRKSKIENWVYLDTPLTRFALGGMSTRNFWKTRRETFQILRANGYAWPLAAIVFAAETIRSGLPTLRRCLRG